MPGGDDEGFARDLLAQYNVTVLPGSYLARHAHGHNPGRAASGWHWWLKLRSAWRRRGALWLSSKVQQAETDSNSTQPQQEKNMTLQLESIIDDAWENRANINMTNASAELRQAVEHVIAELDAGRLRVATREGVGRWTTHQWIKKAVLLSFRLSDNAIIKSGELGFYDKVRTKFARSTDEEMKASGVRVVPPAVARRGCFIAKGAILMPSFVNIGAYVDEGTMVDTWATVGSCAQIGKGVHLSGGVGIGGVLEPVQANPTIIEDNCFVGARSEIVEGVIVEENSVISMGVFIGQSTKIYDRTTGEIIYGRVPAGSVVVSGNLPSPDGKYSLYCAVIVKRVDAQTRQKTSLNDLLRD